MKRVLLFLFLGFMILNAQEEVEVQADKFWANEKEGQGIFTGNVVVTKGSDILKAEKLTIYFDQDKNPLKYVASGNATGNLTLNGIKYFGKGEIFTYEPKLSRYTIQKNGMLHEIDTDRKVYGEFITVNQTTGSYEVDSKPSEPVKFIFKVDEKEDEGKSEDKN
jgi:lipopolysaccharide export system protein LptA